MYHKKTRIIPHIIILSMCLILAPISTVMAQVIPTTDWGELKISVISDPHLYSTSLGTTGSAFEENIKKDSKMLKESELIIDATLAKIKADDSQIVLIAGDLTKDGEKINHEIMAQKLKDLEASGKKVFVINGNHDITNAKAYQYNETGTTNVPTISSDEFKVIYRDFGYDEAISQDEDSLSYVVEPMPGYRIIAIDSCIYNDDTYSPSSKTAGEIKSSTLGWIKQQIKDAKSQGKEIVAMMHHGLVPHTSLQASYYPDFLIRNYTSVATSLADAGLSIVFTGHFHAQDISSFTTKNGNKIYDVETGSLVTYPVPIRKVSLKNNVLTVESKRISEVPGLDLKGATDFSSYASQYIRAGLDGQVKKMLAKGFIKQGLASGAAYENAEIIGNSSLPTTNAIQATLNTVSSFIANSIVNHYSGDEKADELMSELISLYSSSTDPTYQLLGSIANSFSTDSGGDLSSPIEDNNAVITLAPLIVPTPTPTPIPIPTPIPTPTPKPVIIMNGTALLKKAKVSTSNKTLYYGGNTGKTSKIKITVPKGTKYTVSYKTNKKSVATVSKTGMITAKKKGTALITTTIKVKGKSKSYTTKVTVKKAYINITKKKTMMKLRSKYTFSAKGYGYSGAISWYTTKNKIVAITKKSGKASAKTKGTDYVVLKVGKVKKTIKVVVK